MKFTLAVSALVASANALSTEGQAFLLAERFESFKAEHGREYADDAEHAKRFEIFEANMEQVAMKNAALRKKGNDEVHGVTKFADRTEDEFSFYLGVDASLDIPDMPVIKADNIVNATGGSYNWNDEGKLSPVKDQAQCGSCWAFSATETVETAWVLAGNDMAILSPQMLVSCDKNGDQGCNGGLPSNAFDQIKTWGGMCTEADYPYTSGTGNTGTCTSPLPTHTIGTIGEWGYSTTPCQGFKACTEDADATIAALKQYGPISIAVDASGWNTYKGGVLTADSCSSSPRKMDHAVQLVGYNADDANPYWVVRNSWAASWGEDGFIKLAMGGNTCGWQNVPAIIKSV
ncbi:hypothetical protein ScalyP_jg3441 [Parmales sp. scaly parma]|nr:hypothetical protein ScalyP_jg3441 [Parmales sp. scaly parma]